MIKKHSEEVHIRFVTYVHELLELQEMQLACDGIQVIVACLLGQTACCGEGAMMGMKGDFRSQ